jgi:ankyrin repeat protein
MWTSVNGHDDIVRTLLHAGANVNAKDVVRNQMMMVMMMIVINDEDGDDCR